MAAVKPSADRTILTLNQGSSSVKFGLFAAEGAHIRQLATGAIESGDPQPFSRIGAALAGTRPDLIGHRIVHGGSRLSDPVLIDPTVIGDIKRASAYAPLHNPAAIALIEAAGRDFPGTPQFACFDTAFHATLPDLAATLPIARSACTEGIRRYGFHGLSCQSIVRQLGGDLPRRLIVAHLGSGASVTAILDGRSVDTSMGLTPSGGVMMSTRSGDIDPGILFFLARERGMDPAAIERLIDHESGLLGVSGCSGDMRRLRAMAVADASADLAIRLFCRSIAKHIAAMMTVLSGADMIVFTGGIGENDPETRAAISGDLAWVGVGQTAGGNRRIRVLTLPSREDDEIAWAGLALPPFAPAMPGTSPHAITR